MGQETGMAVELLKRRFTVDEFHRMGATGILADADRVELIDGEVVLMTPIGVRHAACVACLTRHFSSLGDRAIVWVQHPVRLDETSELYPDVALLRARPDFYATKAPEPADIELVVEVADTSGGYDRTTKLPRYARAGIGEAWLVDLPGDFVNVYREPAAAGYGDVRRLARGQRLPCVAFPELAIPVATVLG
jgi:Uma2 family endonuclease